jgi:hypothetical protein
MLYTLSGAIGGRARETVRRGIPWDFVLVVAVIAAAMLLLFGAMSMAGFDRLLPEGPFYTT